MAFHFDFERKIRLLFWECVHKSGVGQGTGFFIYALSAEKTSLALAAPYRAITALFSCHENVLDDCGYEEKIANATSALSADRWRFLLPQPR